MKNNLEKALCKGKFPGDIYIKHNRPDIFALKREAIRTNKKKLKKGSWKIIMEMRT